jgi:hypothetical protein
MWKQVSRHTSQPRVRETRMHLHVTHVIRSRLAFLPARIASCAGLAWISLWAESLGSITFARLGLGGLNCMYKVCIDVMGLTQTSREAGTWLRCGFHEHTVYGCFPTCRRLAGRCFF